MWIFCCQTRFRGWGLALAGLGSRARDWGFGASSARRLLTVTGFGMEAGLGGCEIFVRL